MNSFRFEPKHGFFRNVTPVSMKKMKTMRFCNKTKSVNPLKNRDLGVKSKKWFLKNVAPPEIDLVLDYETFHLGRNLIILTHTECVFTGFRRNNVS